MSDRSFDIFVPGRICLFGEHSDWAGGHRRVNSAITPGRAVICGTNQGIFAQVRPHPDKLIFRSSLGEGTKRREFELPMRTDLLLEEARKGGFFSYVAGVAYQVLTNNAVKGLEIDNYRTDLPVRKGLSSSAAVCVLTARAFNLVYDLKMTVRGEMEYAYRGEIATPSRCGRLDQGCAYGGRPVEMRFDGDTLEVEELSCGADFHFIVADLKASKDTVRILADLNKAFPFAENDVERGVQELLGPINEHIIGRAAEALRSGDAPGLGALMTEAQALFDRYAAPACPEQLVSPALHRALGYEALRPLVHGGKGVGSQGDGSVQFLARDEESRERAIALLERDLGLSCLRLTLPRSKKVRKAVITAAGYGTRLFPMTSAVRKEFLPVVDRRGRMLPLILANVEEVFEAGIEEVCIVIQEQDRRLFEDFFGQNLPEEHYAKLSSQARESLVAIREKGKRISFRTQTEQRGLGHAIYGVRDWVGGEPFLLVLGDHLFVERGEKRCARTARGPLPGAGGQPHRPAADARGRDRQVRHGGGGLGRGLAEPPRDSAVQGETGRRVRRRVSRGRGSRSGDLSHGLRPVHPRAEALRGTRAPRGRVRRRERGPADRRPRGSEARGPLPRSRDRGREDRHRHAGRIYGRHREISRRSRIVAAAAGGASRPDGKTKAGIFGW